MDHQQYIEHYLSADVDSELSPAEQQAVSAHLATCPACRQRQYAERSLKTLLRRRILIVPAPDDLRRTVIAALDAETASPAPAPMRPPQIGRVRSARRPLHGWALWWHSLRQPR
jgi:anti-sigma factor RsiW